MGRLVQVAADRAGPQAVGILLPPGERTILILRPRSLPCDLVLVQGLSGDAFREMSQLEGRRYAEELLLALTRWNERGSGSVGMVPCNAADHFQVWLDLDDLALVACERRPGQAYEASRCTRENGARLVSQLQTVLCPVEATLEVYLNTRHFDR